MKWLRLSTVLRSSCLLLGLQLGALNAVAVDVPIYADSLASGWSNFSWDSTINFSNTTPVHAGSSSIAVTYTNAWAALYLHTDAPVATNANYQLSFWIHGGTAGGQRINVSAWNGGPTFAVTPTANSWTQVTVPFSALGATVSLAEILLQDSSGGPQPAFFVDDVVLVPAAAPPPQAGPALSVNVAASRHAISDDIYGMNYADEALAAELRLPVRRWGGNGTSRYNWQNDTSNTGMDWYFENIRSDNANPATLPDGSAADRFVEQDRRTGTRTLMTVPLMGWVAKRRLENHPYDCGFKVTKYGAQQSVDPWDTDCGNGKNASGTAIAGNDPADTSTAVGPAFITSWINHLTGKYGTAATGGVPYYALDNEPMLWNSTHRDVHPLPLTYDEIRDRGYQYGAAIKAADPSARIFGPVEWGWCGYFYSAADPNGCSIGADYAAHGNTPFVAWYLQQMKSYEQLNGVRILDYFDLHYYPAANGVSLTTAGSAATRTLRLRSTRSLWDPAYVDESWISDLATGGIAVQMIPRMKDWVNANYPGTRLAITEYNWGGLENINGAVAQADVLGIFGREGLDLATIWGRPDTGQPGAYAFRMYRNYDGAGHGFGETSVQASSADQGNLSVYAAQRAADDALTLIVVNKSATDLTSVISLAGFDPLAAAKVYRYSGAALATIERPADQALTASGFSTMFPGNSITLFVILPSTMASTTTDLGVTQSASPSPAWTGKDLVYTLTVANGGPAVATGVTLTDTLPAGSTFVWATPGCANASGTVTCTLGTLANAASTQVKVVVRPSAAGSITNNAMVSGTEADANAANNSSASTLTVNTTPVATLALRYRLYSPVTLEHHFTTDLNEYTVLGGYVGTWVQEGTVGKVLNNPGSFGGVTATPYYRLYNTSSQWHHWTTDVNEYYTLIQFPWWTGEGVDGYILPTTTAGATQLYRLLYPFIPGLHHWTIDPTEYSILISTYGWIGEGGSGYVVQ